jgi:hypothetical protein
VYPLPFLNFQNPRTESSLGSALLFGAHIFAHAPPAYS